MSGGQHGAHSAEQHAPGHAVSIKILVGVWLTLMVLTVLTVQVATIDLGKANLWVAMFVASIKASLVVLFFMHLFWDRRINLVIFLTSVLLLALFLGMTLTDTDHYQDQLIPGYSPAMEGAATPAAPQTTAPAPQTTTPPQTVPAQTVPGDSHAAPASGETATPQGSAPAGQEPASHK